MTGVILAGGLGTRLYPFTKLIAKSAFPIYDKPSIFFQLALFEAAGVREAIIRTNKVQDIQTVLADEHFDLSIRFLAEEERLNHAVALERVAQQVRGPILVVHGDIFITPPRLELPPDRDNCYVYVSSCYKPDRISNYGVVELGDDHKVVSFEEKPSQPKGTFVHMGVTFFPADIGDRISRLKHKSEKDMVDIANEYLEEGSLFGLVHSQPWFNMGTPEEVLEAALFRKSQVDGTRDAAR